MNAYILYMAKSIAEEIKSIEDPLILAIYLKEIVSQRCKIGGAKEGTCKRCRYKSHDCRDIYNIAKEELQYFEIEEEIK